MPIGAASAKPVLWIGSSLKDLSEMPGPVQRSRGTALRDVQLGEMPSNAKWLRGLGSGVIELKTDHDRSTYRLVLCIGLRGVVYVLHVFKKKSKRGIETPREHIGTIRKRLHLARLHHQTHQTGGG